MEFGLFWLSRNALKHCLPAGGTFYFLKKRNENIFFPSSRREPKLTKGVVQQIRDQRTHCPPVPRPPPPGGACVSQRRQRLLFPARWRAFLAFSTLPERPVSEKNLTSLRQKHSAGGWWTAPGAGRPGSSPGGESGRPPRWGKEDPVLGTAVRIWVPSDAQPHPSIVSPD